MSDSERIDRLERIIVTLAWALARQGTESDGNWGYTSFGQTLREIVDELPQSKSFAIRKQTV